MKQNGFRRFRIPIALTGLLLAAAVAAACLGLGRMQPDRSGDELSSGGGPEGSRSPATIPPVDTGGIGLDARAEGAYFYTSQKEGWHRHYIKGVNMGLTLPTTDLSDPDIDYDTYMEWFAAIAGMNANTVRVFTIMNPDFYSAFSDFNRQRDTPLYLIHGIWFNENDMTDPGDPFAREEKTLRSFERSVRETIDIVHGSSNYTVYGSHNPAVYDRDISPYVLGYVLGLEWLPDFVESTNRNNAGMAQHKGQFLYTNEASPFEVFLARVGETLIAYETRTYRAQHPVAFLNWQTTDTLTHTNEPFEEEDRSAVNTEAIRFTGQYYAGLFAAVDVYPYYPEFMNHQPEYREPDDETGQSNPYRAYLRDLRGQYAVPVLVAEYGLSTSRGKAHESVMGYHQGGLTETEQGEMVAAMSRDIAAAGYAGGLVFSWQDEWFKQTWNTVRYAPDEARQRGLNVESAEQRYGILACEPGAGASVSYPDGSPDEWTSARPAVEAGGLSLYAKMDEAYLHLMIRLPSGMDWQRQRLAVGLALTGQGSDRSTQYALVFDKPVDFLLIVDGKTNTRLLTEARSDRFYVQHTVMRGLFTRRPDYEIRNSGLFGSINTLVSNEIVLPLDGQTIPPQYYESGFLRYGNGHPGGADFDSLADFCAGDGVLEFRLPWSLINVMNGPRHIILDDLYEGFPRFRQAADLSLGLCLADGNEQTMAMATADWPFIDRATYHTRLKVSYAILRDAFAGLTPD